jgi:hypothetical protein
VEAEAEGDSVGSTRGRLFSEGSVSSGSISFRFWDVAGDESIVEVFSSGSRTTRTRQRIFLHTNVFVTIGARPVQLQFERRRRAALMMTFARGKWESRNLLMMIPELVESSTTWRTLNHVRLTTVKWSTGAQLSTVGKSTGAASHRPMRFLEPRKLAYSYIHRRIARLRILSLHLFVYSYHSQEPTTCPYFDRFLFPTTSRAYKLSHLWFPILSNLTNNCSLLPTDWNSYESPSVEFIPLTSTVLSISLALRS